VAIFTGLLAIFTFLLIVANAVGLYLILKQWETAANTQKDTREQLRALIALSLNTPVFPANFVNNKPTVYAFVASFHNYGGTRTANFTAWASVKYFDGEVPNNQDFSKPYVKTDNLQNAVIAPNGDIQVAPVTVTSDEVAKAVNKQGVIVLWGHADWADVFNTSQIHHISFCLSPNPVPSPVPPPTGSSVFQPDFIFQTAPFKAECNASD
jgi:hypothetical protein